MNKYMIRGGCRLYGEVTVSGAKNAAVAIIPAALLVDGVCRIENIPQISDVTLFFSILEELGAKVRVLNRHAIEIDCHAIHSTRPSYDLARRIRASYYLLGALLGRCGHGEVFFPGGCEIGSRPIDQHLKGFAALGAETETQGGRITARTDSLQGGDVFFDVVTVGGTINVMLAAAKAHGNTTIHNAAREPHIVDLANFLNSMGGRVRGAGTDTIRIRGVDYMHGSRYSVIPDQIETGTLMIAAAATHGDVTIRGCIPTHMEALTAKLLEMGVQVTSTDDTIRVRAERQHRAVNIKTQEYPGFPTDLQQPMSAMLTCAAGDSLVIETIFENRFKHLVEMQRMGAKVRIVEQTAIIEGVDALYGAPVTATDLRAGAALVIAGLMAKGTTEIYEPSYIERGYERIEDKLRALGADIARVPL